MNKLWNHYLIQVWCETSQPSSGNTVMILPLPNRRWNGEMLDSPRCLSVRPSVRPSVYRQGFRNFLKKLLVQFISYQAFTLMGWVSWLLIIFMFLASYLALWWPNIWPKIGFPELFEKTTSPIHFIPSIYPYGVSLFTPIHFRVPSLIFGPLVTKYLAKNGVSGTFWKTIGSIHFIPGIYHYGVSLLIPILFRVPSFIFDPLVAKYLAENGVSDCKIEIFIGYFWMR